jgi:outer membrane lipoprotein carrier protein
MKSLKIRSLMFACCALFGFAPAVFADTAAALQEFLNSTKVLKANFTQVLLDDRAAIVEESKGFLLLRRPGEFRWEYRTPFVQEIVSDGKRVFIHDEDLSQVTIRAMGQAMGGSPALLLTTERPVSELFEIAEGGRVGTLDWVELKPREQDVSFTLIRVGMNGSEIAEMELSDTFGQTTQLKFADLEVNPPVDDEAFTFQIPAGADVIDESSAATKTQ